MAASAASWLVVAILSTALLIQQAWCVVDDDVAVFTEAEMRLRDTLQGSYDKSARPSRNASVPVELSFYMSLGKLLAVNVKNETIKLHCFFYMQWEDERLAWDPDDYEGIKTVNFIAEDLWAPPIFLHNGIPDATLTGGYNTGGFVTVSNTSRIIRYVSMTILTRCQMNTYNFPYDQQVCNLSFSSHDGRSVAIKARRSSGFRDRGNDWQVVNLTAYNETYAYSSGPDFSYIIFSLTLLRRSTFYIYLYIVPPVLVTMLIPFLFLLHTTGPHRTILGTAILLCMCLIIGKFDWSLAGDGGMPKVGQFYIGGLAMSAVAYVLTVVVAAVAARHKGPNKPPAIISMVIGNILAKVLFVSHENHDDTMPLSDPADAATANGTAAAINISELPSLEWLHLARVLDRTFFILFSILDVILMFTLLL